MKLFKTIFLSLFTLFITFQGYAQRAKDGNYSVSTSGDVVNTYTSLIANANAGVTTLTVANNAMSGAHFSGNLAPGDLIMIVQMYGADVEINTFPYVSGWGPYTVPNSFFASANEFFYEFGRITNYNNAGKFEQVEVTSVSGGNTINLQCGLKNSYDFAKKVQIIRIPRYNNLTVNNSSSIVPLPWDGTSGGVVALEIETALTVNAGGLIHANGLGFRGGQLDPTASKTGTPGNPNDLRFLGSPNSDEGSEKGEGIFGYHIELDAVFSRWGISGVANGGGGGGFQNAGGGGGSNVSATTVGFTGNGVPDPTYNVSWALDFSGGPYDMGGMGTTNISGTSTPGGGRGGYALAQTDQNELTVGPRNSAWGGDDRKTNGGRGGHPLAYDATRLFFGGGGGAGDQDGGQGGAGGNGGGIVYIKAYGTITGSGNIEANGGDGQGTNPLNQNPSSTNPNRRKGNDGAGGGGAGGAVFIENSTVIPATINLNAIGGDGGNQNMRVFYQSPLFTFADEAAGPGGSGAGGSIAFTSGTPAQNVSAGSNGIVISQRYNSSTGVIPTPTPMMQNFPPNGATNGSVGMGSLSAPYYDLQIADITTCVTPVTLTVTVLGTIPSGGTIGWYTQEFGGSTFATGTSTSVSPAVTTTYYVGVCPGSFRDPVTVTVTATAPTPTISGGPTTFCTGGSVLLTSSAATGNQWSLDGTPIVGATNQTYSATTAGNYTVIATSGGCTSAASLATTVTINPIPATPTISGGPTTFCTGGSVLLTSSSATGNQWSLDGTPIGGATNQTYLATAAGNYTVIATTGGCPSLASAATTVTINPIPATPTIGAGGPLTFCSGGSVLLTSSSATGNQWSLNGTPIGGATNQTYSATASGDYTVITTSGGCPSLASAVTTVSVTPTPATPTIGAGGPTAFCSGGSVLLTSSSATGNQWLLDGTPIVGATNQTYSATTAGDYTVIVTASGCPSLPSSATTVTITANPVITIGTVINPSACATATGSIQVNGTATGVVSWTGTAIGNSGSVTLPYTITGLAAGTYNIIITVGSCPSNTLVQGLTDPSAPATPTIGASGPVTFCTGGSVTLTSSSATGNQWSLNGTPIGGATNQTLIVNASGDYTVVVTSGGCTSSASIATTVTVNPIPATPTIAAGGPLTFCAGGSVTLTSSSASGNQWSLSGTPIVGATNQTYAATATGDYTVIVTTGGCLSLASVATTVTVNPLPATPTIGAGGPLTFCAGGSVTLTSSSVTGNQWSLNGTPIVGATNQTYSATASGDYTVMVTSAGCSSAASAATTVVVTPIPVITAGTVTNPSACGTATGSIQVNGSATGVVSWTGTAVGNSGSVSLPYTITGLAAGTYNIIITVGTCSSNTLVQGLSDPSAPATPTVAASGPITFCAPGSVTLTSSSAAGNQWSLNGTPIGGATNQTLIVSASGDYTVVVTSGGCTSLSSAVTTVTANAIPTVTATNDGPICIGGTFNLGEIGGDAVSWAWSSSGGATITANTDQSPIVTGAVDGEVFTVVITDANTCTNSANTAISVIQSPVLDAITDVVNCGPYTLPAITGTNLTGSEAYYDNSIASGGAQITGPITSTQTVWVYDGIATCEDEISFQVTINPLPSVVSFTGGSSYCDGDIASDLMIDVTGSADWSINYTLNGVAQNIVSSTTPISIGNAEGVYVLTGISDVNCSNSASQTQTIIITATPAQPVASSDVVYCTDDLPGSVSVSGAGGTYTWYTDNALTSVYGTGSIVTVLGTTQVYYVTESLNGCESTPDEVSITFENCEVVYPTAFTPDGDGTNDTWEILGLDEKYPDNTLRIYNRWGNLIFEHESSVTNPYNNSQWDGTYKGAPLPVGSFYYIIDVKGSDEKIKGTVSIILN